MRTSVSVQREAPDDGAISAPYEDPRKLRYPQAPSSKLECLCALLTLGQALDIPCLSRSGVPLACVSAEACFW